MFSKAAKKLHDLMDVTIEHYSTLAQRDHTEVIDVAESESEICVLTSSAHR